MIYFRSKTLSLEEFQTIYNSDSANIDLEMNLEFRAENPTKKVIKTFGELTLFTEFTLTYVLEITAEEEN